MKDTKLLNAEIPADLHKELRLRAVEEDETIRAIVERALREYLGKKTRYASEYPEPPKTDHPEGEVAMRFARMAVMQLEGIHRSHHDREDAFNYVQRWLEAHKAK